MAVRLADKHMPKIDHRPTLMCADGYHMHCRGYARKGPGHVVACTCAFHRPGEVRDDILAGLAAADRVMNGAAKVVRRWLPALYRESFIGVPDMAEAYNDLLQLAEDLELAAKGLAGDRTARWADAAGEVDGGHGHA